MSADLIARLREVIEGPARLALDTGEAQAVDVTEVMSGEDVTMESIAVVQRAIDAVTTGTAGSGYAVTFPMGRGSGIAVVFRGVAPMGGGA